MPCGQLSKQGPATIHQVRPSFVEISRHHKELLLPTQVAAHGLKVKERKWKPWFLKEFGNQLLSYQQLYSSCLRLAGIRTEASAGFPKSFIHHLQQIVAISCFCAKPSLDSLSGFPDCFLPMALASVAIPIAFNSLNPLRVTASMERSKGVFSSIHLPK